MAMNESGPNPLEVELADAMAEVSRARSEARASSLIPALLRAGQICSTLLDAEGALAAFSEARNLAVRLGDRYDIAAADDLTGLLLCHLDRPAEALPLHQRAAAEFASLGHPEDESLARSWAAWALIELGRPEEALAEARRSVEAEEGNGLGVARAIALADLGRIDEAMGYLEPVPDPEEANYAWYARATAHVLAREGSVEEAAELFAAALGVLRASGDLAEHRCCLRQMGRLGLVALPR